MMGHLKAAGSHAEHVLSRRSVLDQIIASVSTLCSPNGGNGPRTTSEARLEIVGFSENPVGAVCAFPC
jgi:hypothetical protein